MTFKSNWKPSRTARKKATLEDRRTLRTKEDQEKTKVRRRDKRCRFPLCGCGKLKLRLEVSHQVHKGMGGNPKGDRSTAAGMVLLCEHRHQHGIISRHKGTLHAVPLYVESEEGCSGPVVWYVDAEALPGITVRAAFQLGMPNTRGRWIEVARERAVQQLEPLEAWQRRILESLAEMDL